jgi:hypothetical protein
MRCIVAPSGVLTIHNINLTSEGENVDGGGATESGGVVEQLKVEELSKVVEPPKVKKNYWKLWSH